MYLRTLGGLALEGTSFSRPKPLLLLAYLALEGPKSRRYLAEVFFMETSDRMNSLSRALSDLRKEVPDAFESDSKKVWTNIKCDAVELIEIAENKQLKQSLDLYKGAFAVDYNLELSEDLSEWLYGTREILAGKARNAFLQLGEQEAAKGNFSQAALLAEKAYNLKEASLLEPDDFPRLYALLYAGGSPLAAEVKAEAEGFDISLTLSREEAKAQFEVGDVALEIPNNLPLAKTTFVGRDQELIEIAQQLAKPECRLLTLHGMGGIGKSRTAIQVAYDQVQNARGGFTDGVYFIALDALSSADMIPSAIAEVLDFEMQGIDNVLTQVQKYIGKKKILLILDNFEHLMDGAVLPSKLLESCPNQKIIVTTREVLKLEEEWVKNLEGLHYPANTNLSLEEAQGYEAVQLFIQRAKRTMLDFSMTEENMSTMIEICQLVEGAPLALELSATWVRVMTLEDIVKEIKSNLDFLERQSRNGSERHQSIRAVFEHSWKLLTAKEQEVLKKLSIFVGGFRREAAAEVTGATLPILTKFVDKALLWTTRGGRYHQHFLLYQFCQDKLKYNNNELIQLKNKHEEFYFDFIESSGKSLWGAASKEILKTMDDEVENIQNAWYWAVNNLHLEHIKRASELVLYYDGRSQFQKGIDIYEYGINRLDLENPLHHWALGSVLIQQGWLYHRLGKYENVFDTVQRGISLLRPLSAKRLVAIGLNAIGISSKQLGDFVKAKQSFEEGLEIAKELGVRIRIAPYLNNLTMVECALGNYKEAKNYNEEALIIYSEHNNLFGTVITLTYLSELLVANNELDKAKSILEESWQLAEKVNFHLQIPYLLCLLGNAEYGLENLDKAKDLYWKSMKMIQGNKNPSLEAKLWVGLGAISAQANNDMDAEIYFKKAMQIAWTTRDKPLVLKCLLNFGELRIGKNIYSEANEWLNVVLNHPATHFCDKLLAQQLLNEISFNSKTPVHIFETTQLEAVISENFPWVLAQT